MEQILQRTTRGEAVRRLRVAQRPRHRGRGDTRRDRIDIDVIAAKFGRGAACQLDDAGFRGRIGHRGVTRAESRARTDINDAAAPAAIDHVTRDMLHQKHGRLQVYTVNEPSSRRRFRGASETCRSRRRS